MRSILLRRLMLLIPLVALFVVEAPPALLLAQDGGQASPLIDATLQPGDHPIAPAFVRLLRITLEPGASSPLHTHPGSEIVVVERGVLTVQVGGAAQLTRAGERPDEGTPAAGALAPADSEFELAAGDQLVYLPQTAMTFRNAGSERVSLLTVVLLPAGHQHPPGVTYLNGQPAADAFEGVVPQILGDGVASSMPANGIRIVVDELRLEEGAPIPAFTSQIMLSLEQGGLDFTVVGGKVQVSRGASPGPQADSAPGTEIALAPADALYAPLGLKEALRPESDGPVEFLRLRIEPSNPEEEPTPSGEGVGEILVTGSQPTPTSEPDADSAAQDGSPAAATVTAEPDATPAPTATPSGPQEGDSVAINSDNVNIRACGSTECDIVTQVFLGQTVTILGAPEDDGAYLWWPVSLDDDPSITGYIAQDFLDLPESGA